MSSKFHKFDPKKQKILEKIIDDFSKFSPENGCDMIGTLYAMIISASLVSLSVEPEKSFEVINDAVKKITIRLIGEKKILLEKLNAD